MMLTIPALLSPEQTRSCRDALGGAAWGDGRETAGPQAVRVKQNQQLATDDPLATRIGNLILEQLGRSPLFIAAALPQRVLPPRFNRYSAGGHYGPHIDNAIFTLPGGHRLRSDLSATLFLSEPEGYDGGELVVD
jgi:PKHD-type hydroxylase